MSRRPHPTCPACSPSGLETGDVLDGLDRTIRKHGWAVQSVLGERPFTPAFCYTVGLERKGKPELIVFAPDIRVGQSVLHEVVKRVTGAGAWEGPFVLRLAPGRRVQLRPALGRWREAYALAARAYWGKERFRLWQVRLPDRAGEFPDDGVCCNPPCQPLLDREDPWHPVPHEVPLSATDVLWHRVLDADGGWDGRWETLGGVQLGGARFIVLNVPFLADDVTVMDTVGTVRDDSGRILVEGVETRSHYTTVRIRRHEDARGRTRLQEALAALADEDSVVWECPHLPDRYWVLGVPLAKLAWVEAHLRPLRREGVITYEAVKRSGEGKA